MGNKMPPNPESIPCLPRDLGDGLILRQATAEDTEAAAEFQSQVHLPHSLSESFRIWTRDLMNGALPGTQPNHFTLVEKKSSGAIVSMLNLIPQTWSYGGIEVGVGRIELVSTHPDYRRRGLVRIQMEAVHEMSARRGDTVQVISGIPWYYRQFGYEFALDFEVGYSYPMSTPPATQGPVPNPYRIRPATEKDIPFIARLNDEAMSRYLVSCVRNEELWRYELSGKSKNTFGEVEICVVGSATDERMGFLVHGRGPWQGDPSVILYELRGGASWGEITPSVVRYLGRLGQDYAAKEKGSAIRSVAFELGFEHPVYQVLEGKSPSRKRVRAWYVRVADITAFLRHVTSVLERRITESAATTGHTGKLTLGFVDYGVGLSFEQGRLAHVERLANPRNDDTWLSSGACDALFPELIFLQLLFGFRSIDELEHAFPDCVVGSPETRELLALLFPKLPSHVWGIA